jgi:hypothetical protein
MWRCARDHTVARRTADLRLGFRPPPVKATGLHPKTASHELAHRPRARPRHPSSEAGAREQSTQNALTMPTGRRVAVPSLQNIKPGSSILYLSREVRASFPLPIPLNGPQRFSCNGDGRSGYPPCHRNGATFRYLSHRNSSQIFAYTCIAEHNCSTWSNFADSQQSLTATRSNPERTISIRQPFPEEGGSVATLFLLPDRQHN